MLKILIRPEAKADIKKIWIYTFETWGEKQADIYTTELGQAIDSLVDNPEIGFTIDHVKDGYRLYRFRHHFVIYTLTPIEIDVTRILGENMYIESNYSPHITIKNKNIKKKTEIVLDRFLG